MNSICPVSHKMLNEPVLRLSAAIIFIILLVFFQTLSIIPIAFLAFEFFIRAIDMGKYSVINFLARNLASAFKIKEKKVNAGPKIFASRIGFFLSVVIISLLLLSYPVMAMVFAGVLVLFTFLEAACGFCMACVVYPFLYQLTYKTRFGE